MCGEWKCSLLGSFHMGRPFYMDGVAQVSTQCHGMAISTLYAEFDRLCYLLFPPSSLHVFYKSFTGSAAGTAVCCAGDFFLHSAVSTSNQVAQCRRGVSDYFSWLSDTQFWQAGVGTEPTSQSNRGFEKNSGSCGVGTQGSHQHVPCPAHVLGAPQ